MFVKKHLIIFLLVIVSSTSVISQMGGGVRFAGNYYLAKKDYKIGSYGGFITYSVDGMQSIRLGGMVGIPFQYSIMHTAYANDTVIQPRTNDVIQSIKLNTFSIFAEYQKYFSDFSDSKVGVYANVGFAYLRGSATSSYENINANYTIPEYEFISTKEKEGQLILRASMGLELRISTMKWFVEAGIGMPGSTNDKKQITNAYLPGYLEVSTGIRF